MSAIQLTEIFEENLKIENLESRLGSSDLPH